MPVYQFSLLIQAAGTALLLILFLLVYQKIRLRALSQWIVSWACLLIGLAGFCFAPPSAYGRARQSRSCCQASKWRRAR